ncbi:hypothetical protein UCRPC4_g01762 [Phaeomoniella chlamydospora]|uniref:Uncharacterized protein n=1 Tax=Phaeomoniella chlamydospora TaxID=158046 RepID=A0A0G2GQ55_PHACM|nr:hypothetical protein UCRPC4_g01762 [Phaeomoniella chlamydospora]
MLLLPALSLFFLFLTFGLCAEDYYKLLGLDKSCSDRDIKRAYKTLSKKYHPDKNPGDESAHQKFMDVSEAYETLSDSQLREIYDKYGHEGIEQHKSGRGGGGGGHDPFDLFSRFFGGSGHFGRGQPGVRKGPDMEVRLALPLRDFYNGKETSFTIEKQQICEDCEGSGSADGHVETCDKCGGQGIVIQRHMLAPGMFQQVQTHCDKCGGKGKTIKHVCPVCQGQRVVRKPTTLHATIERGMPVGHRIIFENEADESPDWEAGNMIVTLIETEPELSSPPASAHEDDDRTDGTFFRRKGPDLFWKEVLSLREAWMGDWTRNITHLDGHVLQLSRPRGQVVQPSHIDTVSGEGMPLYHDTQHHDHDKPEGFGKLYVEYTVVLPDQMESGMEKDFHALFEKWRKKNSGPISLDKDSGRPNHEDSKIRKILRDEL